MRTDAVMMVPPEVLALAVRILSVCAVTETTWTRAVASMVKVDPAIAAAMLDAVVNPRAKSDVIRAAARVRFSGDDLSLCHRALDEWIAVNTMRRPYAHDIWLYAKAEPDAVVFLSSKDAVIDQVEWLKFEQTLPSSLTQAEPPNGKERTEFLIEEADRMGIPTPALDAVIRFGKVYDRSLIEEHVKRAIRMSLIAWHVMELTYEEARAAKARAQLPILLPPPAKQKTQPSEAQSRP
jgi:hypothetical protein